MKRVYLLCLGLLLCGCAGGKSTDSWIAQTQAADPSLRLEAVRALTERRSEAAAVVPALVKSLGDSDAAVRRAAAQAVGNMGADAKAAVPGLLTLLEDRNTSVRKVAALALKRIDPERAAKR
jgi:HEAT repeat protein